MEIHVETGERCLLQCRPDSELSGCPAGTGLLYVTASGDIFPCASVKRKLSCRTGHFTDFDIQEKLLV